MSKRLAFRLFSLITMLFTALILFNPKGGVMQGLAWGPKLLASALAPVLAVLGGVNAWLGLLRRDWLSLGLGCLGGIIATKHVIDTTTSHLDSFAQAFGPDWEARIPAELHARMRPYRWRPFYRRRPHGAMHQNIVYGTNTETGQPLLADFLQPPPGVPRTGLAMIFVHGGAWWYGRKNIRKFPYFRRLVFAGHMVMDINYTLAPHTSVLEMAKDVQQAILWLKQHAATFQINPERIVLTGQSAGAQLCLLVAYSSGHPELQLAGLPGDTSVRGVISYEGPPDLVALYHDIQARFIRHFSNRWVDGLHRTLELLGKPGTSLASGLSSVMGGTLDELPELYRQLSPVTYICADCPPTLLLQGTHDLLVDYRTVQQLYQNLREANVPAVYIPFPGCNHAFESVLPRLSPPAQSAAYYTERFLALLV